MKPILQHEQRLQKYANTHPLRVPKTELTDHKKQTAFSSLSELYRAPGPEKLPRGLVRSSRGAASLIRSARPATSLPFRPAIA